MKALVQRTIKAKVTAGGKTAGEIGKGVLVLLGVEKTDEEKDAEYLAGKTANLRIFSNEEGKFFYSLTEIKGEVLSVSQFTLCADTRKGRRPDFTKAAKPEKAKALYELFNAKLAQEGLKVETGVFAAEMKVELVNDGPVTILLDSAL